MQPRQAPGRSDLLSTSQPYEGGDALGFRAQMLLQRIVELDQAVTAEEWWLLGRVLPEARLLAEISSLLAVARGELEYFLSQFFGQPIQRADTDAGISTLSSAGALPDAATARAHREQALHLLRVTASSLPTMRQYATMLKASAERLGLAMAAIDALNVVADRLGEAYEALRQPPV